MFRFAQILKIFSCAAVGTASVTPLINTVSPNISFHPVDIPYAGCFGGLLNACATLK
jgi:hypothetical protein